jgi:hypothetical protein
MDRFTGPRVIVNNDVHRVSERKHPARSGLLQLTDVLLETQSRGCHASPRALQLSQEQLRDTDQPLAD